MNKIKVGKLGEDIAIKHLINKHKHRIIDKNYSKPRWGEIDIISVDLYGTLYFSEVKTRTNTKYGNPVDAITPFKLHSINRSIKYFLFTSQGKYNNMSMKFIVISILIQNDQKLINTYDFSDKISVI